MSKVREVLWDTKEPDTAISGGIPYVVLWLTPAGHSDLTVGGENNTHKLFQGKFISKMSLRTLAVLR